MLKNADERTPMNSKTTAPGDGRNFDEDPIETIPINDTTELRCSWTRKHWFRRDARLWHFEFRGYAKHEDDSTTPIRGFGLSLRIRDIEPAIKALRKAQAELVSGPDGRLERGTGPLAGREAR